MKRTPRPEFLTALLRDLAHAPPEQHSLARFKKDTARFRKQLRSSGRPVVLTSNGKPALVVQDAAAYSKLIEAADFADTVCAITAGLADSRAGRYMSLEEFDRKIRKRHGLRNK